MMIADTFSDMSISFRVIFSVSNEQLTSLVEKDALSSS